MAKTLGIQQKNQDVPKSPALFITEVRMLLVRDYCISQKVNGIGSNKEWYEAIGMQPTNASAILSGRAGFTKQQMQAVGRLFGISMDYLYGFTDQMHRSAESAYTSEDLFQNIRASLALLEMDYRLKAALPLASRDSGQGNTSGNTSPKNTSKTKEKKK